jgi:uncharacterized protein YwgA
MTYAQAYQALITEQNLPTIKATMTDIDLFSPQIIEAVEIRNADDLKYLYCPLDLYENWDVNAGMLDSTFVDFGDLLPEWTGNFYFPILFMCKKEDYRFHKYLPYPSVLAHELLHLRQMIDRITAEPTYITRASKCCLDATTDKNMKDGLRFEIEKIFKMEAEAHALDWDLGVRHLMQWGDGKTPTATEYTDKKMYVQHGLVTYIGATMQAFNKKFPKQTADVTKGIEALVIEFGTPYFGKMGKIGFAMALMNAFTRMQNPLYTRPIKW